MLEIEMQLKLNPLSKYKNVFILSSLYFWKCRLNDQMGAAKLIYDNKEEMPFKLLRL